MSSFFFSFDGNGNVGQLMESASGTTVADYEYGAFGELLRVTGPMALGNPFRFSTHYADQETGILYAKRRYYATQTGGWLSRDPIGEEGGINLYGYVGNSPVNRTDPLGLAWYNPGDTDYILNFDYALRSWLSPIWNTDMTAADEQAVTIANAECTYRNSPMRGFVIGVRGRSPLGNGYDNSVGFSGNLALSWTMDSGFTGAGGAGLNLQGSTASGSGNFYGYAYNEEKGGSFARGLTLSSDRARVSGGLSHGVFSPNITLGLNLERFGYAGVVVDTSKLKVW